LTEKTKERSTLTNLKKEIQRFSINFKETDQCFQERYSINLKLSQIMLKETQSKMRAD
jgi:hypothetical protein